MQTLSKQVSRDIMSVLMESRWEQSLALWNELCLAKGVEDWWTGLAGFVSLDQP